MLQEDKMEQQYTVIFNGKNTEIRDASGVSVSPQAVHLIIRRLIRAYPKACEVYLGKNPITGLWKIGMSHNVARRAEQLSISVEHTVRCQNALDAHRIEWWFHLLCAKENEHGEWFSLCIDSIEMIKGFDDYQAVILLIDTMEKYIFTGDKPQFEMAMDKILLDLTREKTLAVCEFSSRYCALMREYIQRIPTQEEG